MSTVIPSATTSSEESSANYSAPKKKLRSVYESVLTALHEDKRVILITGDARKGKTALIHTVSKYIAEKNRIITISGKDLPSPNKRKGNSSNSDLYNMKDFFLKSTDLGDRLVVFLDDAHCLPINFLSELIEHAKGSSASGHCLQLIMSGPLAFKDQLMSIKQIDPEDLVHYPINTLSEQAVHSYAQTKTYKIASNIKQLEFKPESLRTLADFIQSNQQVLDVILEWCAALTKKDRLTSVSTHTINRAVSFAQQYAKDKNLGLDNAYPPSHEVYKYINNAQSTQESATNTSIESDKKPIKIKVNKPFIKPSNKASTQTTITSKVEQDKEPIQAQPIDEDVLQSLHEIEKEIMPLQWTSSSKQEAIHKKSFPVMAVFMSLLILGFIIYIAFRIGSDPKIEPTVEAPLKEQIALNAPKQAEKDKNVDIVTKPHIGIVASDTNKDFADSDAKKNPTVEAPLKEQIALNAPKQAEKDKNVDIVTKPHIGIVASDTNKDFADSDAKKNPTVTSQQNINKNEQAENKIADEELDKELDEKLLQNKQEHEKELKIQDNKEEKSFATAEINKLLVLADHQFENKQLSTPSGDNALETYKKILAKYPNNKAAANGIKKIHDKYMSWANYYLKQNHAKRAKQFYIKALHIDPVDTVAISNLQAIAQQEAIATTKLANEPNTVVLQDSDRPASIQKLLTTAQQNMQQIEIDIGTNTRTYSNYQEAQIAYQDALRAEPQSLQAKQGLSLLKSYYADWAELQVQSKNYNIALFLYGQALQIEPGNLQIAQRIEQILALKKAL